MPHLARGGGRGGDGGQYRGGIPNRGAGIPQQRYQNAYIQPSFPPGAFGYVEMAPAGPTLSPGGMMAYAPTAAHAAYAQAPRMAGAMPEQMARHGKDVYAVEKIIQPRTDDPTRQSNGIRLLRDVRSGLQVIEKTLMTTNDHQYARAKREVRALEQVRQAGGSPNINAIYSAFFERGSSSCVLLLENCDRSTIEWHIQASRKKGGLLEERFCWHVLTSMISALSFLHYGIRNPEAPHYKYHNWNTLVHLDIKPANVFVTSQHVPGQETPASRIVLGDFGCVVTLDDMKNNKFQRDQMPGGTVGWLPPEIIMNDDGSWDGTFGKPTDMWQTGGVIQTMCKQTDQPSQVSVQHERPCGRVYSDELNEVLCYAMHIDQDMRPTAIDLFKKVEEKKTKLREEKPKYVLYF